MHTVGAEKGQKAFAPGFLIDETLQKLSTTLKLPPWLESSRSDIAAKLPAIIHSTDSDK